VSVPRANPVAIIRSLILSRLVYGSRYSCSLSGRSCRSSPCPLLGRTGHARAVLQASGSRHNGSTARTHINVQLRPSGIEIPPSPRLCYDAVPMVHSPVFSSPELPPGHRFPMQVFQTIYEHLLEHDVIVPQQVGPTSRAMNGRFLSNQCAHPLVLPRNPRSCGFRHSTTLTSKLAPVVKGRRLS
jgi:hypothetical protein